MAAHSEQKVRHILPRWRSSQQTARLGELDPVGVAPAEPLDDPDFIAEIVADWRSNHAIPFAAELVSCAFVLGQQFAEATEASEFILKSENISESLSAIAKSILGIAATDQCHEGLALIKLDAQAKIHLLRRKLTDDPRNAIAWTDLAHAFAGVGQVQKSKKAIGNAIALAPESRFVVRSGSRLFVHSGDHDLAHDLVNGCAATPHDPWLLATEVATAQLIGRTPRFAKRSRQLLKSGKIDPRHLSELASAIATLELGAGAIRRSRKFFRLSLDHPNENAVAQARWAAETLPALRELVGERLDTPGSYEARSWAQHRSGEWELALENALKWLEDQPFSSGPAAHGSFLASVCLEKFDQGEEIATKGLRANPQEFTLKNNAAFSLACLGRLDEAERHLELVRESLLSETNKAVHLATQGLIAFRRGNFEAGRKLYLRAIEQAHVSGDKRLTAFASIYYAFEVLRAHTADADTTVATALERAAAAESADLRLLSSRLTDSLEKHRR